MRLNSPQINLITRACMKASKSLIRDFGEIENLQVSSKGPGDFVSSADKRTEKILIDELQKAHPDYGILTEEKGIINKSNTENRWIIDPIDGTMNFLNGVPHFAISIAYEEKKAPMSTNLNISFHRPLALGKAKMKVNLVKLGTRSATSEGRIFNLEGELVATLMHTAQPVDIG